MSQRLHYLEYEAMLKPLQEEPPQTLKGGNAP